MTNNEVNAALVKIQAEVAGLLTQFPYVEPFVTVQPTEDLQAALNKGGEIHLVEGATYSGNYTLPSNTVLVGNGASIAGTSSGPALYVPLGAFNVYVSDLSVTGPYSQLIRIGRNDTSQNTVDLAPSGVTFERVKVPTHRGTRAFEVNGKDVYLLECEVYDTYSPALQDSQGVAILNSPGPVTILGGAYQAGSENIMVGGDTMKIPGVIPTDIIIQDVKVSKPLSWRTDGVNRAVKNLIELKTGRQVTIVDNHLSGCWSAAQDGPGIVITPKSGGDIHDVLIEDNIITDVAYGLQVAGQEYHVGGIQTPSPVSGVVVKGNHITARKANSYGANGYLAKVSGGDGVDLTFDSNVVDTDGTAILAYDNGMICGPSCLTQVVGGPIAKLVFTNNYALPSNYGFNLDGNMNLSTLALKWVTELVISGNTFGPAASAFKTAAPLNTYVDRMTWDGLVAGLGG